MKVHELVKRLMSHPHDADVYVLDAEWFEEVNKTTFKASNWSVYIGNSENRHYEDKAFWTIKSTDYKKTKRTNNTYEIERIDCDRIRVTKNAYYWTESVVLQWWDFEYLLDVLFIRSLQYESQFECTN